MEQEAITVANPDWFTPFIVCVILSLTSFFVWVMQSLIGHKVMVLSVLGVGIATGIAKFIDPMAHRVLASLLLLVMLGFCIHFTWKTWPRARWTAIANAVTAPATAFTAYMLFVGG
ncbi:MAG: hypothetical protein ACPG4N_09615 [Gammaproteobacteria bacterium]